MFCLKNLNRKFYHKFFVLLGVTDKHHVKRWTKKGTQIKKIEKK